MQTLTYVFVLRIKCLLSNTFFFFAPLIYWLSYVLLEVLFLKHQALAVFPDDGMETSALLSNAGVAMRHAKQEGGKGVCFYARNLNAGSITFSIESELRRAIENDELCLYYQPMVDLPTGRSTGAEALLRWKHPARGIVLPDEFIPVAEVTGVIVPIGAWVLRTACAQIRRWQTNGLPYRASR